MEIKGKTIGTGKPLLCVPVMESNKEEIIDELRTLAYSGMAYRYFRGL